MINCPENLKLSEHHSVADFDWFNQAYIALDTGIYVSPPSSLTVPGYQASAKIAVFLCKIPATKGVNYGRIVSWLRFTNALSYPDFYMRNQDVPPQYTPKNTFRVVFSPGWATAQRIVNSSIASLGTVIFSPTLSLNTWHHLRVSFHPVPKTGLPDYLGFTIELEIAGVWVKIGATIETSDNRWFGSAASRMGGAVYNWKDYWSWFDDTEFWVLQ